MFSMCAGRAVAVGAVLVLAMAGCGDDGPRPIVIECRPGQPAPYPESSPYAGVHGNRENNDDLDCATGSAFVQVWHALEGQAVVQPNTFSPDGAVTYVTASSPDPDGDRLFALDVHTGEVLWSRSYPQPIIASAVEVDADGFLYFTVEDRLVSLAPDGSDRWEAVFDLGDGGGGVTDGPIGLHFTPDGHIATVTSTGVVFLLDRATGAALAELSIPDTYGFVAPAAFPLGGAALLDAMPEAVRQDFLAIHGTAEAAAGFLGAFLGAGGSFSDNTIGVSSRNELFVVGGGPDDQHGALVQLRIGGTAGAPTLEPGWHVVTDGGSATSPSITFDGQYVNVGDGAGGIGGASEARLYIVDVDACDGNTDDDTDPTVCAPLASELLARGSISGAPPMLDGPLVPFWETGLQVSEYTPEMRDVGAFGPSGVAWEATLPNDMLWTSVMTVTRNHIIGTASRITPSDETVLTLTLPASVESEVLVLDRNDGSIVARTPVTDDSAATVTVGPEGGLYAGLLGLVGTFATEHRPTLGLVKLAPTTE